MQRRTQAERREQTTTALLTAARELFAERGFADTGREDIAARAGVTRGALYHHFESKAAVAIAVVELIDRELTERVVAAALTTSDPAEQVKRSARAYVAACAEPDVARILLEAPLVLSPDAMREMNATTCARLLEPVIDQLHLGGDPGVTARLLLGLLDEAARMVAAEPRSKRKVIATVDALLEKVLST